MTAGDVAHLTCDKGRDILGLAVRCGFISAEKQQKMLSEVQAWAKDNPKALLAPFLRDRQFFSKEKIHLLFSIKKHIEMLQADRQFGKLGVANRFVSPGKVQKALDVQVRIFRETQKSIKIGDILLQSQDISAADKTALLLTQDRIPDALLSEALYTIAQNEYEQMGMEKRFGAIAVKKGVITAGQLSRALKQQADESGDEKQKRYLGEILKELFDVSEADITGILKIQKKLETNRMKLEDQLDQYNARQAFEQHELSAFFNCSIAKNKLEAHVRMIEKPAEKIDLARFMAWFSLSGVRFGCSDPEEIQTFLDRKDSSETFVIARGTPPRPSREEKIKLKVKASLPGKDSIDSAGRPTVPAVAKNDVLAAVTPGEEGRPGTDVFGRPVKVNRSSKAPLGCGEGVILRDNQFVAAIDGIPALSPDKTLSVVPLESDISTRKETAGKTVSEAGSGPAADVGSNAQEAPGKEETPGAQASPRADVSAEPEREQDADKPDDSKAGPETKEAVPRPRKEESSGREKRIDGDVTADTNDDYTEFNLRVTGSIAPGVLVTCHDLVVDGDVHGNLSVTGDIKVAGAIGKAAGGESDPPDVVLVTARGRLQAGSSISHAKVFTGNGVRAPKSDLISASVSSCGDIVVNNVRSGPQGASRVTVTRHNPLEKAEMAKVDQAIRDVSETLDTLLGNDEIKALSMDLMRKEKAVVKYHEKQRVLSYVERVLTDPEMEDMDDVAEKIRAFEAKNQDSEDTVAADKRPDSAEAQALFVRLTARIREMEPEPRLAYLTEFRDGISGMAQAAEKAREKLSAQYQAMTEDLGDESEGAAAQIEAAKKTLGDLEKKRALLAMTQQTSRVQTDPVIKVKNEVEPATVIRGETARLVIDKAVYGVSFREDGGASGATARIVTSGYFE